MVPAAGEIELRGPHLVLAHIGDNDGLALGDILDFMHDILRGQPFGIIKFDRVFLFVAIEFIQPIFCIQRLHVFEQFFHDLAGVADAIGIGFYDLSNLRCIDINVQFFRADTKFFIIAVDTVIPAGADG